MTVYYNEIDPYAAQWLRNLIAAGHIAPGVVDERSIEDIAPKELHGFTQCHFFAGIGVWSLALRNAGWPDDRPVWTGSCPCQPFSSAGKGAGFDDERHLWPAFHHLVKECKPSIVFGEQVASKDADPWIDLVHADLEALGYAFGAVPFPSASVGAPHIRDRLYWVAACGDRRGMVPAGNVRAVGLADSSGARLERCNPGALGDQCEAIERGGAAGRLAHVHGSGLGAGREGCQTMGHGAPAGADCGVDAHGAAGPTNGHWRAADWLLCRDGKWRPVEPGTFPLANGAASRVGRLRAYGNAINAIQAQVFVEAYLGL